MIGSLLLLAIAIIGIAAVVYTSAGPSLACFDSADGLARPGISGRVLISGGRQRCYLLYVPRGYDPARPAPVVFALHGFAGNGSGLRSLAVWEPVAEKENFIVVYPDGSSFPLRWNVGPQANIPRIDDVQFIRDIIAHLSGIATIDPTRIYVTGFSNGGQMTHRIACNLADQVSAIGIVDGFDGGMLKACSPARPVPMMAFFGTANPLAEVRYPLWFQKMVNVTLDESEPPLPPNAIEMWMENWAESNGCNPAFINIPPIGNASGVRYTECQNDAEVVLYTIEGQGHAWPGGPAMSFLGSSVSDINASETLWEFFEKHPLRDNSR